MKNGTLAFVLIRQITFALFIVLASVMGLRAGPADDLFKAGNDAYAAEDYPKAIENYEKITKSYASASIIDDVKLRLGLAYLYAGKYAESADILSKLTDKATPADIRERAFFYLGQAQLSLSGTMQGDEKGRQTKLGAAVTSFTELLNGFAKSEMREDAYYNRALASFFLGKYDDAEKDFQTLVKDFSSSVNKADYAFWLARTYGARSTSALTKALADKKPKTEAESWGAKAKEAYARITDADSLIVANDARFEAAELDFYLSEKEQYARAIEQYNKVRRREDLLPDQKAKIEAIRAKIIDANRAGNKALVESLDRLRTREQTRLNELLGRVDPAIKAAIRKAQCYVLMTRYDEARVVLHRLKNYVTDEGDKKDVGFQTILAYALQKQVDKANAGLDDYLKSFPGDKDADIISFQVGNTFMEEKEYQQAFDQYARSLRDFPKGRYADQSTLRQATAMLSLGQVDKAIGILSDFVAKNPKSPVLAEAQYSLGSAQSAVKKFDEAAKSFRAVKDNPNAGPFAGPGYFQLGYALFSANQMDPAIQEFKGYLQKFPQEPTSGTAALYIGMALAAKKDPTAIQALQDVATKYPNDNSAAFALNYIATLYKADKKIPEMIAAYEKVYKTFPKSKEATSARVALAGYFAGQKKFDDAAKLYQEIIKGEDKASAGYAAWGEGNMWFGASKEYGAYTRVTADEQKEIRRRLEASEKAYVTLLKEFPEAKESGAGLQGLLDLSLLRSEYGLLPNDQVGKFFTDIIAQVTDLAVKARLQLLQAAVPYEQGRRDDAYAEYKKVLQANPNVPFTPGDARRYGELLIEHNEADAAVALFTKLQENTAPDDQRALAEVAYGIGSASFAKKDNAKAKENLERLVKQYGWHPKAPNAQLSLARIEHAAKNYQAAKPYLTAIISSQKASGQIKGEAMIEMGDIFADEGTLIPGADKSKPNAAGYYDKADAYFGDAIPEIGGQALLKVGQMYEKAGQPAEARKRYEDLIKKYGKTPYAAQAKERLAALPAK